jgi:rhodanese-related sulfurtransferase
MEVPRITVDALKAMMDRGKEVTILDVRQPEAYASSNKKIKGSVYLDPNNDAAIKEFAKGLDKNSTIVAYCT